MPRISQAHAEARRQQILEAARLRFARSGFHRTRMEEIATEAGLSVGALYDYFDGKEALVRAVVAEVRGIESQIVQRLEGSPSVLAALGDLVSSFAGLAQEPRARPTLQVMVRLWGEAVDAPEIGAELRASFDGALPRLAAVVERGQERGEIRADLHPAAVVRAVVALVNGAAVQLVLETGLDLEDWRRAAGVMIEGLRAAGPNLPGGAG